MIGYCAVQIPLIFAGLTFVVGAAIMASAVHIAMIIVGRLILGLGVGVGTTVRIQACLLDCGPLQRQVLMCFLIVQVGPIYLAGTGPPSLLNEGTLCRIYAVDIRCAYNVEPQALYEDTGAIFLS